MVMVISRYGIPDDRRVDARLPADQDRNSRYFDRGPACAHEPFEPRDRYRRYRGRCVLRPRTCRGPLDRRDPWALVRSRPWWARPGMGGANRATRFEARRMDRYAPDSERSLHRLSFARRRPATVDPRSLWTNAGGEGLCGESRTSHRRLQSVLVDSHDVQIAVATLPFAEYRHRICTVDWRAGTGGTAREHATGALTQLWGTSR